MQRQHLIVTTAGVRAAIAPILDGVGKLGEVGDDLPIVRTGDEAVDMYGASATRNTSTSHSGLFRG